MTTKRSWRDNPKKNPEARRRAQRGWMPAKVTHVAEVVENTVMKKNGPKTVRYTTYKPVGENIHESEE